MHEGFFCAFKTSMFTALVGSITYASLEMTTKAFINLYIKQQTILCLAMKIKKYKVETCNITLRRVAIYASYSTLIEQSDIQH